MAAKDLELQAEVSSVIDHWKPWNFERILWTGEAICDWRRPGEDSKHGGDYGSGFDGSSWVSSLTPAMVADAYDTSPRVCGDNDCGPSPGDYERHEIRAVVLLTDRALYILHRNIEAGGTHQEEGPVTSSGGGTAQSRRLRGDLQVRGADTA